MHRINELFEEVTKELWAIKRLDSKIEFKDLIDFYKDYQFHENLLIDAINEQIHRYTDLREPIPFSNKEISHMIDTFIMFNENSYNRLIVDTLCSLNCEQGYHYLNKILDNEEKTLQFKQDVAGFQNVEKVKKELRKLGNEWIG